MNLRPILASRRSAEPRQPLIRIPSIGKIEEKAVKTHLLCAMALGLAGTATAASAQDSDTFLVQTNVAAFCANMGAAPGPLALGELADLNGFVVTTFAGPTTYSVPGYYCNAPATVTLAAGPLLQTTSPAPTDAGFTNRVDYTASLVWDDVNGSVDSVNNTPATIPSGGPNVGDLIVTVSAPDTDGDRRPIAGDYAGAVTLTIVAN